MKKSGIFLFLPFYFFNNPILIYCKIILFKTLRGEEKESERQRKERNMKTLLKVLKNSLKKKSIKHSVKK